MKKETPIDLNKISKILDINSNIDSDLVDLNILENKKEFDKIIQQGIEILEHKCSLKVGLKIFKSLIALEGINGLQNGLHLINKILSYLNNDMEIVLDWINNKCYFWFVGYNNQKTITKDEYQHIIDLLPKNYNFEKFKHNFTLIIKH